MSLLWEIERHRIDILCTYYPKNPKRDRLYFSIFMLPVRRDYQGSKIVKQQFKESSYLLYHDCKGSLANVIFF